MLTVKAASAPAGEFEKHAGCWMGWPDSGYLWRDNAEPAQEQYANIAKAISEFEPLTMVANAGAVRFRLAFVRTHTYMCGHHNHHKTFLAARCSRR
jgi:agmatine/peptidylarginine deiminase